ncbi:cytochrome [Salmonella enterica subsp. enterica serovar Muenchen]|nr:cytochrome [Salmonella enterica subsp. enterica serovar Muenchen]EHO5970615.1 cytochrome [Salmonella enterica]
MKLHEMLAALSPKRESLTIGGFTFYARPMSVVEFNQHIIAADKNGRDEISILNCIVDEDGNQVFETLEQVQSLYTTVKSQLIGLVASASLMPEASEVEEAVK